MVRRLRGSRPVVGSSRKITRGSPTSVMARSSRRRIPPEKSAARRPATSAMPNRSSNSCVRARPSRLPSRSRSAMRSRFSSAVSRSSRAANWPVTPIAARTRSGAAATSCPATSARPPSAGTSVERMLTVVVLPAPFGPSRAKTEPAGMRRSMPSRTVLSPYALRRPVVVIAAGGRSSPPPRRDVGMTTGTHGALPFGGVVRVRVRGGARGRGRRCGRPRPVRRGRAGSRRCRSGCGPAVRGWRRPRRGPRRSPGR